MDEGVLALIICASVAVALPLTLTVRRRDWPARWPSGPTLLLASMSVGSAVNGLRGLRAGYWSEAVLGVLMAVLLAFATLRARRRARAS